MQVPKLMKFDPVNGTPQPYPSEAQQYRDWHGATAWLYNPYSGVQRDARDVGTDVFGKLIFEDMYTPSLAEQSQAQPLTTGFDGLTNLEIAAESIEREMIRQSEKAIQEFDAMETDLADQEQPLISAEEARKLGAGNAEYRYRGVLCNWEWQEWIVCGGSFEKSTPTWEVQYRAIKHSEPQQTQWPSPYKKEPDFAGLKKISTENLPPEFEKILHDNLWELYEYAEKAEPTCQVRNLDTGELKTMARRDVILLLKELGVING